MENKDWGGKRQGAGRPKAATAKIQKTVMLDPAVLAQLDELFPEALGLSTQIALLITTCRRAQQEAPGLSIWEAAGIAAPQTDDIDGSGWHQSRLPIK